MGVDYKAILQQSSSPYLILAPDPPKFTIIEVTNSYLKVTMTKREDIIGKSLFEVFPDNPTDQRPTGERNLKESLNKVIITQSPDTMAVQKYDIRGAKGTYEERWWTPVNSPVFDSDGKLDCIIHHVEDVTRFTKVQEKKTIQKESLYRPKIKTEMLHMQKHFHKFVMIGFLISLLILTIVGLLAYKNISATAISDSWERRTNLIILSLEKLLALTVDAETGLRGFIITGDQKYLKPYEQALNKISQQLDSNKILAKDDPSLMQHMKIIDSLVYRRLAILKDGIRVREIEGFVSARNLIITGKGKLLEDAIRQEIATAQKEQVKLLQIHSDEKLKAMNSTVHILIAGALLSFFVLILTFILLTIEINRRMKSEEGLQKAAKDLERSNKDLEQFTYFVSHDLQEPLRAITGFLSFLKQDYGQSLSEDAIDDINEALAGAGRMQNIIQDLLTISRVSTRAGAFKATDINTVLDNAIDNLYSAVAESSAEIRKEKLPMVIADETQMVLLFQNLIGNAIKYRGNKKVEIRIWAKRDKTEWIFAVSDNGIGIASKDFDTVFQIFQRLVTREEYPGTGVGLAVCKRIVERHGGKIWVESKPGDGSTFFFTIPDRGE